MFTPAQVKAECQNDPSGLGLAAQFAVGSDGVCADILNVVRVGITVKRVDVRPAEVLEAINTLDFAASPSAIACSWFESLTQMPVVRLSNDDGSDTTVLGNLKRLVTSDVNGSRTRLAALTTRPGSRAEQLWGPGTSLTALDITNAHSA